MKNNLKKTHFLSKILCLASMLALSFPIAVSAQIPIDLPPGCVVGALPADPEDQIILICTNNVRLDYCMLCMQKKK